MSKYDIINRVRQNISEQYDMPYIRIKGIQYPDKTEQFIEINKAVGGDACILKNGEDINALIKKLYPDAKVIASNLPDITICTINPDDFDDPHKMGGIDLSIIKGELGVAENGCVWIPQNVKERVLYFISENLVILLDRNKIVNNMHEAYSKIEFNDFGFGVFMSGPSKTADIEQALVIGAHGAKGVTVVLC